MSAVGGGLEGGNLLKSAELYDSATGLFTTTAGTLNARRFQSASVLLGDGRVLIAGGNVGASTLDTAEIYDPATTTFTLTANEMSIAEDCLPQQFSPMATR